jgi:hypothetical protein
MRRPGGPEILTVVQRYSPSSRDTHTRSLSISEGDEYLCDLASALLSDVRAERLQWLWPGRIPLGALTLPHGDPDSGGDGSSWD